MGNDGGSIPKRRELVKEAARLPSASERKATVLESQSHAWSTCPLSSEPLDPTTSTSASASVVVSDWRGRLYNYESVLQCLAPSLSSAERPLPETQAAEFARTGIRGLKDVAKLRFTTRRDESGRAFPACPLSMKELGPAVRSVYLVPCGHVFAEIAIKESLCGGGSGNGNGNGNSKEKAAAAAAAAETTPGDDKKEENELCPECSTPFLERDIIPILPTEEPEIDRLARRADELKALGLTHTLKKDKSSSGGSGGKKKRKAAAAADEPRGGAQGSDAKTETQKKISNGNGNGISSRINNSATASLTARVLAEQEERNKRRRVADGYKRSEAVR